MTNSIGEIELSEVLFAIGTNTTENHPVIAAAMKRSVRNGKARLIVADPREIELVKYATLWLRQKPGTDVALLNGMMNVIIDEGLWAKEYVETRTENFEAMKEVVKHYTPEYAETVCGVPAEDIRRAARIYAGADRAAVLYTMGITQHTSGVDNVKSIANLAMLCGNVGIEGGGVNPLRGQNNVQGACDMGCLPNVLTGYQPVTSDEAREKFEKAWGVSLPATPGLTVIEAMNAAYDGTVKALYIMGENPMLSDPDLSHAEAALKRLDLLVVQDILPNETAQLAHVVLPSACFAEKEGTFANTERRVQRVRKAVEAPGQAKEDGEIIAALSTRMGYPMQYGGAEDIMNEIRTLTPSYAGIRYERLEKGGIQWPCPTEGHPGTTFLHKDRFTRGLGLFSAIEHRPPAEEPDAEYPFVLTTGRVLYHYHTANMTKRSAGLMERCPESLVEINPRDAEALGISGGSMVRVTSRRGSLQARPVITERVAPGVVFMNFHFGEAAVNLLTNAALDPIAKIPELKVCAVRVEAA